MIKEGWGTLAEKSNEDIIHFAKIVPSIRNEFLILNSAPLAYDGHFVHGKMIPCSGSGCKVCNAGYGKQIRYCFGVYEYRTNWRCVLELSAKQTQALFDRYLVADDARFLKITIVRLSEAKTSNMKLIDGAYITPRHRDLYRPVPVREVMEKYWKGVSTSSSESSEASNATAQPSQSQAKKKPSDYLFEARRIEDYNPF